MACTLHAIEGLSLHVPSEATVKVRNVMTHDVVTCRPEETLGALANKMWDGD